MMKLKKKNRNDIVLILLLLLITLGLFVFQAFRGERGSLVVVRQDGRILYELSLEENRTGENALRLESGDGYNLLVIEARKAFIREADCPDKLCVKQRAIFRQGESLICLPHRLVVTVENGVQGELDAVTY